MLFNIKSDAQEDRLKLVHWHRFVQTALKSINEIKYSMR